MKRLLALLPVGLFVASFFACTDDTVVPVAAKNCQKYCDTLAETCTNDVGGGAQNAQFATSGLGKSACLTMCGAMATGTEGDRNVDSLSCRTTFIGTAAELPNDPAAKREACYNAGPFSLACSTRSSYTGEGRCDTFCTLNAAICQGNTSQYNGNKAECMSSCARIQKRKDGFAEGLPLIIAGTGDSLICRAYHLEAAAADAPSRASHCGHTGESSEPCQDGTGSGDAGTSDSGAASDSGSGPVDSGAPITDAGKDASDGGRPGA
jgi:hypothetical protein